MALGGDSSRRKSAFKPAQNRGIIEFFVGNKRNNYSTPVYLFMVFIVTIVLWGAMPWLMHEFDELSLEDRIAALESRGPGGSGISPAQMNDLKALKSEVMKNLEQIKNDKAAMDKTIAEFEKQQSLMSGTSAGDLSGVTANIAKMQTELQGMATGANKYEVSVAALKKQMEGMEGQLNKFSTAHEEVISNWPQVQSDVKVNAAEVKNAGGKIDALEQKLKDTRYSIDSLSSTVASKCSAQQQPASLTKYPEKPNFALRCAGGSVEAVKVADAGLVDSMQDWFHRTTGVSFDIDNPQHLMLESDNEPGQCWCFAGQKANVTIRLISPMVPSEFFLHHIKMAYYGEAKIDMATATPKNFTVVGINDDGEFVLGDFSYDAAKQQEKGLTQLFPVHQNHGKIFEYVKVVFRDSLWSVGRRYTCVYQFGVHGTGALPNEI